MAYVIAICGAGGKTTLCKTTALKYAKENKKVCIITTTHMWHDDFISDINNLDNIALGKVYYFGNVDGEKVVCVGEDDYKKICEKFDYVIIEADGSKSMPMKIPNATEPVIPQNVNEIIIVVGMQSVGREIGYVCHRFFEYYGKDKYLNDSGIEPQTIVTESLIDDFVNHYYKEPLTKKYKDTKIVVYKNYFTNDKVKNVCFILCASGFSKRFGEENKLFAVIDGKKVYKDRNLKLYELMIEKLILAREMVLSKFSNEASISNMKIEIAVITQFDEIINDKNYSDKVVMIKNEEAIKGLSSTVKLGVSKYKDYDAIMFLNADLPKLKETEIANYVYNAVLNNNGIASMFTDKPKNPGYFEKEYFDEILKIDGDVGPKELLQKYKKLLYKYHINKEYLFDIDTKEDLQRVI